MTPRSRVASVPLVGGRAVLDLVNTVSWRGAPDRAEDHLDEPEHVLVWATRAGVLSAVEADELRQVLAARPSAREAMVRDLRELRDQVARVVLDPDPPSLAAAQEVVVDALGHGVLIRSAESAAAYVWRVDELDEHTVRRRLALDLDDLLRNPAGRIGVCADPACGWTFLDTSRAHNRQWCSSRDCGNRHRVQAHARRRTAQPAP